MRVRRQALVDLEMGKPEEVLPQAVTRKDVSIQTPWFYIPAICLSVKQAAPTAILTRQHVLILFLEVARARQRAVLQEVVDRVPLAGAVVISLVDLEMGRLRYAPWGYIRCAAAVHRLGRLTDVVMIMP